MVGKASTLNPAHLTPDPTRLPSFPETPAEENLNFLDQVLLFLSANALLVLISFLLLFHMCFAAHTHTQGRVLNVCVCVRFGVIVGGGGPWLEPCRDTVWLQTELFTFLFYFFYYLTLFVSCRLVQVRSGISFPRRPGRGQRRLHVRDKHRLI